VANLAVTRQDEVFITRGNESGAEARAIQRRAKEGELTRIAEGVYLREKNAKAQKAVVRRNWFRILGALAPGAVVSYRSAFAGGMTPDGVVYLSHPTNFNRKISLPGMQAVLVKGPAARGWQALLRFAFPPTPGEPISRTRDTRQVSRSEGRRRITRQDTACERRSGAQSRPRRNESPRETPGSRRAIREARQAYRRADRDPRQRRPQNEGGQARRERHTR